MLACDELALASRLLTLSGLKLVGGWAWAASAGLSPAMGVARYNSRDAPMHAVPGTDLPVAKQGFAEAGRMAVSTKSAPQDLVKKSFCLPLAGLFNTAGRFTEEESTFQKSLFGLNTTLSLLM